MSKHGISLKNIELSFGSVKVIKNVSIEIKHGEFFTFLGPSGCGKSTLLRLIAGFEHCQKGQILIEGKDITNLPPWKRKVGMVFQSYALWPHMTIRQNIEFGLKEQKMPQKEVNYKVDKVLELVSLTEFASRYPNQLSGGQQQRVALARTVVTEPKVLLLDEPLSNLDASLRVEMRQELLSLQRELNLTTIFVTHDQEEANTTSDRIALLKAGIVQQIDTPNNLYDTPKNLFVANFIGSANILKGNVVKENGECIFITSDNFKIPVKTDILGKCSILLRPHTLVVSTKEDCHLEGKVINKEFLGNMVRYFVKVLNNELIIDSIHFKSSVLLDIGKLIYIKTNENENYILKNE
ncbi:MAG: ABC transporter ATP-binding protein [Campylobacteraceae bacterium]|nr:ABC transporter ATP-binding protein [Campylobacteraceae bacterium]